MRRTFDCAEIHHSQVIAEILPYLPYPPREEAVRRTKPQETGIYDNGMLAGVLVKEQSEQAGHPAAQVKDHPEAQLR